jgi:hypothetical protein
MTERGVGDFGQWVDAVLAGTGWDQGSVRQVTERGGDDPATLALADGFAAARRGRATRDSGCGGAG